MTDEELAELRILAACGRESSQKLSPAHDMDLSAAVGTHLADALIAEVCTLRQQLSKSEEYVCRYHMLKDLLIECGCPWDDGRHIPTLVSGWLSNLPDRAKWAMEIAFREIEEKLKGLHCECERGDEQDGKRGCVRCVYQTHLQALREAMGWRIDINSGRVDHEQVKE